VNGYWKEQVERYIGKYLSLAEKISVRFNFCTYPDTLRRRLYTFLLYTIRIDFVRE
jgi:hypothetical protein